MNDLPVTVVASYLAQAIGGVILAILLTHFYRHYNRAYLVHWSYSWYALTTYYVTGAFAFVAAQHVAPTHPVRLVNSAISLAAAYLQVMWLAFGAHELAKRRPVKLAVVRNLLLVALAIGVASSLLFISNPALTNERYFVRIGIRAAVAAVAFGSAAWVVFRVRRNQQDIGLLLISVAFLLYSLTQANYFVLSIAQLVTSHFWSYTPYLGFVDIVLEGLMGFGMITCLLEDERQAATLASNEIEHLAYHDSLTGLPNRPLFIDRLFISVNMAERSKTRLAVFFCDIDRFKEINDSLGHSVGDELLRVVSERVRSSVRSEDTVARFGGDEFTLILQKIELVDDAVKIAQKILDTVKIPFRVGEHELTVTISIGISFYPNDGRDAETLVKNADTAMYRAKDMGRDSFQLYAPAMNARALEKLALENMLRKALAQQELVVYYQPVIDLRDGTVSGFEALIRWAHPELGLLSPAHFISTAEVSGLIVPIGEWVLRTACKQTRQWQKRTGRPLKISVNLSARQFQQPDLTARIKDVLQDSSLDPKSLQLEITESNAMQNAENTAHTLRELKSVGVCISMDDFGTGYSSLSYLKRFPIDTLKLDRSFVSDLSTDPEDEAIATAVIAMAHSLDLKVIAEGVETIEQLSFLQQRECDAVQGFYFSPPVAAEELERLLVSGALENRLRQSQPVH